jgi:hypothetical protein
LFVVVIVMSRSVGCARVLYLAHCVPSCFQQSGMGGLDVAWASPQNLDDGKTSELTGNLLGGYLGSGNLKEGQCDRMFEVSVLWKVDTSEMSGNAITGQQSVTCHTFLLSLLQQGTKEARSKRGTVPQEMTNCK